MDIRINGVTADIRLENETTVGEVLSALDAWLTNSGYRLSGMGINGETIQADDMELCFARGIETVDTLDLYTSTLSELIGESLIQAMSDIDRFQAAEFDEKNGFAAQWKESPQGRLIAEQAGDLYGWTVNAFSGVGAAPQTLRPLFEERLRELQCPENEITAMEPLVNDICARLEAFPLDTQTGKDARAAETIHIFSGITEKIFRIYQSLKIAGSPATALTIEDMSITDYIAEFNKALGELLAAYEQHDTVLVGDLAEYEMAPRLRGLHTAIWKAVQGEDYEQRA